jgi:hypothetical protein
MKGNGIAINCVKGGLRIKNKARTKDENWYERLIGETDRRD